MILVGATAAVFLACAGAAMVACPPQIKVDWRLWVVAAALAWCGALALLAAGVLLFFLSGGTARDRLLGTSASSSPAGAASTGPLNPSAADDRAANPSEDFRVKIYRDALDVVRDFPLTGVGLGNFALVFPQYRRASLEDARVLHPESDWLMLTAEAGVPAVLCLIALLVLAARRLRGDTGHPYWPLRWGCAVAAGAAALHGVVDVPLHRVQLGWWVLAVGGLALQGFRSGKTERSRAQHALFVLAGVGALALGGLLIRAQWFGGKPLPPFVVAEAEKKWLPCSSAGTWRGRRASRARRCRNTR